MGVEGNVFVAHQADQVLGRMGAMLDVAQPEDASIALEGMDRPEQCRDMPGIGWRLLQILQGLFHEIERLRAVVRVQFPDFIQFARQRGLLFDVRHRAQPWIRAFMVCTS